MAGYADHRPYTGADEATEFVRGATAKARKDRNSTAGAVVAGILSAALFAKKKRR